VNFINSQGNNIRNLRDYLQREENISGQDFNNILNDALDILQRCLSPGKVGSAKGLIYGNIQSGKTAVIITTIALAADNGYKNFIIFTSDLNDLYEQTLDRIKRSLDGFQVLGKGDFRRYVGSGSAVPLVLVSSKNTKILCKVFELVVNKLKWQRELVMIIDDEADQASLDTNINNPKRPSGVNQKITEIRQTLTSHSYLQTTATPQALLLQDNQSAFKPDFVVTTTPGTGYCGGNYFFDNDDFQNSKHICIVPEIDVTSLRTSNQIPDTVKQSIFVFFLGAAILRLQGSKKNYTYLLHTSFKQNDHRLAAELVRLFQNELQVELTVAVRTSLSQISHQFLSGLQSAYTELEKTFTNNIPSVDDVIAEAARAIASTYVMEINSSTGVGVSPNPSGRHTLYIGGQKIGRGVTVKNLLVTYYGRDAHQPQMDTVLQHARMYGYRQNELPAIRIYLPQHLAVRFYDIHKSDNSVRAKCQSTHQAIPVIPLRRGLKPCRRNVINQNTVDTGTYLGGEKYFPLLPISDPAILGVQTNMLDNYLSTFNEKTPYSVTVDEILWLLQFKFADPQSSGAWDDELIRQAISMLKNIPEYGNKGALVIVSRSSNRKKDRSRGYKGIGSVLPGGCGDPPYDVPNNLPALLMTRFEGHIDKLPSGENKGWDGVPFWVPVVRFPDGNYAFSVNYS
jgi:Z1 domain